MSSHLHPDVQRWWPRPLGTLRRDLGTARQEVLSITRNRDFGLFRAAVVNVILASDDDAAPTTRASTAEPGTHPRMGR